MRIQVIANTEQKTALLAQRPEAEALVSFTDHPETLTGPTCYIDLLFEHNPERVNQLSAPGVSLVMINAVSKTLEGLPSHFVRINGWPGFLQRGLTEAASSSPAMQQEAEAVLALFGKQVSWTPDIPGFVSARVVAMIINEAYLALEEKVSSREEIDTAMKLGTNYPYGPFEWVKLIGPALVHELLVELSHHNERYNPAPALTLEATAI